MKALDLTHNALNNIITTYNGDHDLACAMLHQSADEIDVALMALGGEGEPIVHSMLTALAQRMRFVADVASEEESEASQ